MNMEDRDTLIEDYLLDRLPEAEKRAFEAETARDPALAAEVADQRLIIGGLRDARGAAGFRALLGEIGAESFAEKAAAQPVQKEGRVVPMGRRLFSALAIAAALALAFFGWKYFAAGPPASPEQLFAQNFTAPAGLSIGGTRGGTASDADSLAASLTAEADAFFQKKEFRNAHERLDRAIAAAASPAKRSAGQRAKGELFLVEKKYAEAESAFSKMTGELADERDWFVALAVLAQPGRVGEARRLFEDYAKNPAFAGPRQVRAVNILEGLD